MDNGDCNIHLVEECPCDNKKELLIRERYNIDNNECVNTRKAHRTIEDKRQTSREQYRKKRAKISLQSKERYRFKKVKSISINARLRVTGYISAAHPSHIYRYI